MCSPWDCCPGNPLVCASGPCWSIDDCDKQLWCHFHLNQQFCPNDVFSKLSILGYQIDNCLPNTWLLNRQLWSQGTWERETREGKSSWISLMNRICYSAWFQIEIYFGQNLISKVKIWFYFVHFGCIILGMKLLKQLFFYFFLNGKKYIFHWIKKKVLWDGKVSEQACWKTN